MNILLRMLDDIFGPRGALGHKVPNFEPRLAQRQMASVVLQALIDDSKLVVEAGTGTGKTLAYLVPAVLAGHKTVISTGTKTLQEQIVQKDLPLLAKIFPDREIKVACMKGLGNYLCRRRYEEYRRQGTLFFDETKRELQRLENWARQTETGDRADFFGMSDESLLWPEVSSSPETRLGACCPFYESCFVTRMREQAAAADIVVVNHHLLLADVAVRADFPDAAVIPPYEALIIDEAHHLEEIATSFFSRSIWPGRIQQLVRDLRRQSALLHDQEGQGRASAVERQAAALFEELDHYLQSTARAAAQSNSSEQIAASSPSAESSGDKIRLYREPFAEELQGKYFKLDAALEAAGAHLHNAANHGDGAVIELLIRRCAQLRQTLALFAEPPESGFIFWAEYARRGPALHAAPIAAGPLLANSLFVEARPIIFTSATLTTANLLTTNLKTNIEEKEPQIKFSAQQAPFQYFLQRTGLEDFAADEDLATAQFASPFAYDQQALLYLPTDLPVPTHRDFIFRAAVRMSQLIDITEGKALVLFTAHRNLQQAARQLRRDLRYPIFCQGEAPRQLLLDKFRREVNSVLLATASFWEGVDIVGESLSLVIIDKLPFAVPDEPLIAARLERLAEQGLDPFWYYQIPQAALALKQGFGRLIRHREDGGIVAILDRRIVERPYGQQLLASLPPCPRTYDLLRVAAFYQNLRARAK